jgi:transcriptional regulator with XRE-family HTH domain
MKAKEILNMNDFRRLLKSYREKQELSQRELSERCGLSRIYIATLENGTRGVPPKPTVLKIANALALSNAETKNFWETAKSEKLSEAYLQELEVDFLADFLVQHFSKDDIVALTEKLESKLSVVNK